MTFGETITHKLILPVLLRETAVKNRWRQLAIKHQYADCEQVCAASLLLLTTRDDLSPVDGETDESKKG